MALEDFKRIVDGLGMAVAVTDAQGTMAFANAALQKMAGGAQPLPGAALPGLFVEGDRKRIQQNLQRIAEGKTASAVSEARLAGSGERWVEVLLQPALDARDKPAGAIAMIRDIAERRETESALAHAGSRLFALTEATAQAVMIENAAGDVEIANEAFCRLLGLDSAAQSLLGVSAPEVFARSKRVEIKAIEKARKKKDGTEVSVRLDDGGEAVLLRLPIAVDDRPGGALWCSGIAAVEAEAGASEVALIEKIGEELSIALEGISAISIRAQQMEFDPSLVDHFQVIRTSTETALTAIGDLVDFSKVSGRIVLHKRAFGLRAALADLIKRVANEAEEQHCRLRLRVEQDVADQLEGDVERLQLVLRNLLDSAFHLAPGTDVTLQVTPQYVTESGIQLSFSVTVGTDEGRKPTFRASPESGMGVAVAKFMVVAMGGKLAIAPRPGAEAVYGFTIEFPVRPAVPPPRRAAYVSLVGLPVLVVSGDSEQRLTLANLLRGWRMVPMEADNAAMAIALLERLHGEGTPIPLVMVSHQLPVQDGFLLAFRVKHHAHLGGTLMMMLAAKGKPGDAMACRENGIAAYMRYPINERQLNEAIVAVTGASVDTDETPTLVTRHSLREQRKGATLLLVDASRDSQILASHILARRDCNVVVANDLAEALTALEQDFYDLVVVDASLPGLDGKDTPARLRSAITRDADKVRLVAASHDHAPAWSEARKSEGYDATLAKPFNKDHLLEALAATGRPPAEKS